MVGSYMTLTGLTWPEPGLNLLDGKKMGMMGPMRNCNIPGTWPYVAPSLVKTYLKREERGRNETNLANTLLIPECRKKLHIRYVSPRFN